MTAPIPNIWQRTFTYAEAEYLHWAWAIHLDGETIDVENPEHVYADYGGTLFRDLECRCIRDSYALIVKEYPQIADGGKPMAEKLKAMTGAEVNAMLVHLSSYLGYPSPIPNLRVPQQVTLDILHYDLIPGPLTYTVPQQPDTTTTVERLDIPIQMW